MNFLAHILLSGPQPDIQVGGFLGDFVKGPLRGDYPATIEVGIRLHRAIDAYSDGLPALRELQRSLPPPWRRYGGILTDVLCDHLLVQQWPLYHDVPLDEFCSGFYRAAAARATLMPLEAQRLAQLGENHAWLQNYGQWQTVEAVLTRIGGRLRRPMPLQQALVHIEPRMADFHATFAAVFPALEVFAARERRLLSSGL